MQESWGRGNYMYETTTTTTQPKATARATSDERGVMFVTLVLCKRSSSYGSFGEEQKSKNMRRKNPYIIIAYDILVQIPVDSIVIDLKLAASS